MIKRELKVNLKSFIIWTCIIVGLFALIFMIYPSLMNDKNGMSQLLASMPKDVLAIFNMDVIEINRVSGWFATEGYLFVTLIGGCYAAILGSQILLKEESEKTIDFLYARPVSRNRIVTSKLIVGTIYIILFNLAVALTMLIGFQLCNDLHLQEWALLASTPLLLHLIFFYFTFFISTFFYKTKKVIGFSLGIVVGTYFLQVVSKMSEQVSFLKYLSPFEYVDSRPLMLDHNLPIIYIVISIIIIITSIVGTYIVYGKKDFHV